MNKLLLASLGVVLLAGFGCHDKDNDMDHHKMSHDSVSSSKGAVDECPMCEGNQVADKDGKCPQCHMKVK